MEILRDPIWQFVGVVITCIALIFSLIAEWPKLKSQINTSNHNSRLPGRFFMGLTSGIISGALGGFVYTALYVEIATALDALMWPSDIWYYYQDSIFPWILIWGMVGLILALFKAKRSEGLGDIISGGLFGGVLVMPLGLIIAYSVSGFFGYTNEQAVSAEISAAVGGTVAMLFLGSIYGGTMKSIAKRFFSGWIKE